MTAILANYDGRLVYPAYQDRQLMEGAVNGQGILGPGHLLVSAGSGMNSSVATGRALVRNTGGQGELGNPPGGLWEVMNVGGPMNVLHGAADPSNPRIDTVGWRVFDSETGGDTSDTNGPILVSPGSGAGSGTNGATLANRNGAAAWPNNFIPLADVLVPAGASSAASFTYQDRRPVAAPWVTTQGSNISALHLDTVPFVPMYSGLYTWGGANNNYAPGSSNSGVGGCAALMYLPRRVQANFLRWTYAQDGSSAAAVSNYMFAIYDASGRFLTSTANTNFTGGLPSYQRRVETLTPALTLDAGQYLLAFQLTSPLTAGSLIAPTGMFPLPVAGVGNSGGTEWVAAISGVAFMTSTTGTITGTQIQSWMTDAAQPFNGSAGSIASIPACMLSAS